MNDNEIYDYNKEYQKYQNKGLECLEVGQIYYCGMYEDESQLYCKIEKLNEKNLSAKCVVINKDKSFKNCGMLEYKDLFLEDSFLIEKVPCIYSDGAVKEYNWDNRKFE